MQGKEFALKLIVGVSDLASKKLDKIGAIAKSLEKNINKLQNTSNNIKLFQSMQKDIQKFDEAIDRNEEKINNLSSELEKLERELDKTEREFIKSGRASSELANKIEKLKSKIEEKEKALIEAKRKLEMSIEAKKELENQSLKVKEALEKEEVEVNNLSSELEKLENQLEKTAKKQEEFEKKLSTSSLDSIGARLKKIATLGGIGATSGAFLKDIFEKTKELETEARKIIATTDLTTDKLDEVKQHILDLRTETHSTIGEISEVYTQLAQQTDLQGEKLKEATAQILKIKQLRPDWDTKEISRAITQMQKAFGVSAEEAGDLIITTLQKAGDKADDLLDTFWEYSPLMKEAGMNAKEFTAILIAGAKEGAFNYDKLADTIKESFKVRLTDQREWENLVGKGTKKGIIDEMLPEDKFKEKSRRIKHYLAEIREGIESRDDKKKKEGYAKLLTELSILYKQDAKRARAIMEHIFGTQGTEDISAKILKAMGEATLNPDKIVGNYKGALDKAYNESQTFFDKLENIWIRIENVFIKSFKELGKDLEPIGKTILNIMKNIAKFVESHETLTKLILIVITLTAVIGTLGATFQMLALASSFSLGGLKTLLTITTFTMKSFGTAVMFAGRALMFLFANPIGLVVLGITALIMAIIYLYRNWDNVWSWIKEKFQSAVDFLVSGFNFVKNIFLKGLKFMIDFSPIGLFLKAINFMISKITGIDLSKAGKKMIDTFVDGLLAVIKKPFEIIDSLKEKAKSLLSLIGLGGEDKPEITSEMSIEEIKKRAKAKGDIQLVEKHQKTVQRIEETKQKLQTQKLTTQKVVKKDININVSMPNINAYLQIDQKTSPEEIKRVVIQAFREGSTELKWAIEQALKEIQSDNESYIS